MVIDVALIDRNHYLANTDRHENDVEHSYSVTLLAWFIHDHYHIPLDINKILKYALAHDLVERYAGDVNTFASDEDRNKKQVAEAISLSRLASEFSQFSDLITTMQDYEKRSDAESLFVWTVDKMQALIMGDMDKWRPYQELPINTSIAKFRKIPYAEFCKVHGSQFEKASPYIRDVYKGLLEYCKTTYYDRPRKD